MVLYLRLCTPMRRTQSTFILHSCKLQHGATSEKLVCILPSTVFRHLICYAILVRAPFTQWIHGHTQSGIIGHTSSSFLFSQCPERLAALLVTLPGNQKSVCAMMCEGHMIALCEGGRTVIIIIFLKYCPQAD